MLHRMKLPVFLSAVLVGVVGCHEKSVRPGINDSYRNADVEKWQSRFESESREIYQHREELASAAGVSPGMVVADVGAGTGFMTVLFAEAVGSSGKVYAVDITPEFLDLIKRRTAARGLTNVKTVLCREDSVALPAESVDLVFVCDAYHHFEYPRSTMRSIHAALRPGGRLVVVDFDRVPGVSRDWVVGHVRAGKDVVAEEIRAAGFERMEDAAVPFLKENYLLRFVKVD